MANFKTDIEELDLLLGIKDEDQDFKARNKIILIKGGPGSGKTTLGLQLLNNHLRRNDKDENNSFKATYLSLELDPDVSVEYVKAKFKFDKLNGENFKRINQKQIKELFQSYYNPDETHPPHISYLLLNYLNEASQKVESNNENSLNLIFIDSLNILIDIIRSCTNKEMINERDIIKSICEIDRKSDSLINTIFVFSVEFHPNLGLSKLAISESFMCDTEILLSTEPIFASLESEIRNKSSIGYNFDGNVDGKRVNEYRSFCRVLKTRFDNHQSRRCSYDIQTGHGIKFYELYPGDGHVSFFYENEKQKEAWESFFIEDIPHQFPALRHEDFNRKQMQQNFSSRRRFMKVPEKTDLYLSSYDNYWIHWFMDVDQKTIIRKYIQEESEYFSEFLKKNDGKEERLFKKKLEKYINKINEFFSRTVFDVYELYKILDTQNITELNLVFEIKGNLNKFPDDFRYMKLNNNEISFEKDNSDNSDNSIKIKNHFIENVNEIFFSVIVDGDIKYKQIVLPSEYSSKHNIFCLQNKEGIVLIIINKPNDNSKSEQISRIIFADYSHSRIWFKVESVEKLLIYNTNVHYLCKSINNIENFRINITDVVTDSISVIDYNKIIKSDINTNNLAKLIIKQFLRDKLKSDIDSIIEFFYSSNGLRCFSCNILRNVHSKSVNDNDFNKIFCDELSLIRKNKKDNIVNSVNNSNCYWHKDVTRILDENIYLEKIKKEILACILSGVSGEKISINEFIDIFEDSKTDFNIDKVRLIEKQEQAKNDYYNLYIKLLQYSDKRSFLVSLDKNELKIFGERKSEFIRELTKWDPTNNRPIHCKRSLFGFYDKNSYISIPYNANVGIFVYRKDIIENFYKDINDPVKFRNYSDLVCDIYEKQLSSLNLINNYYNEEEAKNCIKSTILRSIIIGYPQTWEEIFAICLINNVDVVLDVKTTDTYYCTFLEMLWNCGGDFHIKADYTFENQEETKKYLAQTYYLLAFMFYFGILNEDSSVQPKEFSEKYNNLNTGSVENGKNDWCFGRFWYSTFIELFNAKDSDKNNEKNDTSYLWNPEIKNKLDLMPMPVSLSKYLKYSNPNNIEHCTSWGDWHLGVIQGSENMRLAKEIIDHLMSSRKIIDNAYSNAILPTTEGFYELYKDTRCFSSYKRNNITMPETTYREFRYNYFRNAKSRSQIYDYRHCMVELNTVLKYIENIAVKDKDNNYNQSCLPDYIVREIEHLLDNVMAGLNKLVELDHN